MKRFLTPFVFSLVSIFVSCGHRADVPVTIPIDESIGTFGRAEHLRLGYLLAHNIVLQIDQYRLFCHLEADRKFVGARPIIEPALHLNLLRAIWLLKNPTSPEQTKRQLFACLTQARDEFRKNPTRIHGATIGKPQDLTEQEPILPRHLDAYREFVDWFGVECIIAE